MFNNFLCSRGLRSQLAVTANDVVTRVNPLQTAIALGSSLENGPCQEGSREQVILGVWLVLRLLKLLA